MKITTIIKTVASGLALFPLVSAAMTDQELKDKFELLTEEVAIAQEQNEDAEQKFKNLMSISGYTDIEFVSSTKDGANNEFRLHHLSLFFEKEISSKWRFFSEIEYEDAPKFEADDKTVMVDTDGDTVPDTAVLVHQAARGKIFVEAVNVTYLWSPENTYRVGRFFTPAGIWSVNHYPSFVPTQERPAHIRRIFPQVVDGVDMFGTLPMGEGTFFNYDLYTGNGEGNTAKHDKNGHKALGLRTSFLFPALSHFEMGLSYYSDTLNDQSEKTATGFHAKIREGNFTFLTEFATGEIDDTAGSITESEGYYAQVLYDIDRWSIGARYDYFDNNTDSTDVSNKFGKTSTAFMNYHSTEKVVLKLEMHHIDVEDETAQDYNKAIASVVVYLGE